MGVKMFNYSLEVKEDAFLYPEHSSEVPQPKNGKTVKKFKNSLEDCEQHRIAAATKIQSVWRGHLARREAENTKRQLLSPTLFEKAKPYIDMPGNLHDLPRASSGTTPVYFPKDLPIILKQSGFPKNQKRFELMKQGREICERSSYEHLVIPRARVYANFIIETRLPIKAQGTKEQIGLYVDHHELFTPAVKEFVGFLCQSKFTGLTYRRGDRRDPYLTLSDAPIGRYDNIALFIEEDQGKIGLVDLEQFSPICNTIREDCFLRCQDAVHLFPLHLKEILCVAKKFDPDIENHRKSLKIIRKESLKMFKITYEDHLNFIRLKGISTQNPLAFEKIGKEKVEELKCNIEKKLRKVHKNDWFFKGCFGKDPAALACFTEEAFPHLLEAACTLITDLLESNMNNFKKRAAGSLDKAVVSSTSELLSIRTLHFQNNYKFVQSVAPHLSMLNFEPDDLDQLNNFAYLLLDIILEEMEKAKVIAYYNPSLGYTGLTKRCVFC